MRRAPAVALALAMLAAALPHVPEAAAATLQVEVRNFSFTPRNATIAKGDAVRWTWLGGTHNVLADGTNAVWCSTRSSGNCTRTFESAGNFSYHCGIHPSMRGWVFVGGEAPTVVILEPPEGIVVSGRFTVRGTAAHPSGIARVELQLGGGPWVAALGAGNWSGEVDSNLVPDGDRVLRARAHPVSGPAGEAGVAVQVQNPPVALEVWEPAQDAVAAGPLLVAGAAWHPYNDLGLVRWRADGGAWQALPLAPPGPGAHQAKWSGLLQLPPGRHALEFQAHDAYPLQDSPVVRRDVSVVGPAP